jgi:hypothetical protein
LRATEVSRDAVSVVVMAVAAVAAGGVVRCAVDAGVVESAGLADEDGAGDTFAIWLVGAAFGAGGTFAIWLAGGRAGGSLKGAIAVGGLAGASSGGTFAIWLSGARAGGSPGGAIAIGGVASVVFGAGSTFAI